KGTNIFCNLRETRRPLTMFPFTQKACSSEELCTWEVAFLSTLAVAGLLSTGSWAYNDADYAYDDACYAYQGRSYDDYASYDDRYSRPSYGHRPSYGYRPS